MGSFLIPCPNCHCHAKGAELSCPSCGEPLRRGDGSVPRTAVAVLLGLSAAGAVVGACGNTSAPFYGVAMTTSGAGGAGGAGGGGAAGDTTSSSSSAVFYGPAMTTSSGSGGADDGGTDSSDDGNDGGTDSGDGG